MTKEDQAGNPNPSGHAGGEDGLRTSSAPTQAAGLVSMLGVLGTRADACASERYDEEMSVESLKEIQKAAQAKTCAAKDIVNCESLFDIGAEDLRDPGAQSAAG